jgi:hypothetical protein
MRVNDRKAAAVVRGNNRFYYRQAFGYSKERFAFFLTPIARLLEKRYSEAIEKKPGCAIFDRLNSTVPEMKAGFLRTAVTAMALSAAMAGTANAAGCLKGAVVGGVAGHYAGHHAVVGALGGCVVGRHMAKKHAEEQAAAVPPTPQRAAQRAGGQQPAMQ